MKASRLISARAAAVGTLICSMLIVDAAAAPVARYFASEIFTEGSESTPLAMNESGQIVGRMFNRGGLPFVTGADGVGLTNLNLPVANIGCLNAAINAQGDVVATCYSSPQNHPGVWVWRHGVELGTNIPIPGAIIAWVYGINDHGQIVGTGETNSGYFAYRINLDGSGFLKLPAFDGSADGAGINNLGQVVGSSEKLVRGNLRYRPFVSSADGLTIREIAALDLDVDVFGRAINDAGAITATAGSYSGGWAYTTRQNGQKPERRTGVRSPDIGLADIAQDGSVVGTAQLRHRALETRAVIGGDTGRLVGLQKLVVNELPEQTVFWTALAVNERGQILVGATTGGRSDYKTFLVCPKQACPSEVQAPERHAD